jgi:hypothetical protein
MDGWRDVRGRSKGFEFARGERILSLMSVPIPLEHDFTCPVDVQTPKAILCSG